MREDPHALTGPYALDALDDDERRRFEAHLAECGACAAEVGQFVATAARLGLAIPAPPSPYVRERVLAAIPHVQQLPAAFPDVRGYPTLPATPHPRDDRPRPRRRAAVLLLAAACVIAATVSGGIALREHRQRQRAEAAYGGIASILSAPDARTATGRTTGGGTMTIVASASRGRVVIATSGLRALPASHTYQLWLIDRTGPHSAGLLAHPDQPVTTGNWQSSDKVALTVEPTGGSPRPTTTPLAVLTAH